MATGTAIRNDRFALSHDGTEPARGYLIADVLDAGQDLRHCGDAAGALRLLASVVHRIVPEAALWAAHRASGADVSETASYGFAYVGDGRGQPPGRGAAETLDQWAGRLADGCPPFQVAASETPLPALAGPGELPPDVSVFPMSSAGSRGAFIVTVPLARLPATDRALIAMLEE